MKGDLHWKGSTEQNQQMLKEVVLRVDSTGIFEIKTVYNMTNMQSIDLASRFPVEIGLYLYATSDTVYTFYDQKMMKAFIDRKQITK